VDRYLRLLRRRDFALLWTGATISAIGDGMSFVALVWLILDRGGDPPTVGWLAAAYTAPVIAGGLLAGLALDRFDRRRLLAADNLVRGIAIASIPIAASLGSLTTAHVFVVAAVYGFLFMVSLAGIPSMIPSLVDGDELTTANAMESISYGIAGLAGPAIAGTVIALAGPTAVLALDAVSYGVFVVCLLAMRPGAGTPKVHPTAESAAEPAPASRGLRPAIRFVLRTPAILAITVMFMSVNVAEGMLTVFLPVFTREVLGGGAATYGLLASAMTLGLLAGALLVGAVGWRHPLGRSIAVAQTLTGLALLALLGPAVVPWVAGTLVVAGLFASMLTAWAQTVRMRLIPAELRGRVFALLRTLMQSTPPIGAVIAGFALGGGSFGPAVVLMAALAAVPGAIGLVLPALGRGATAEPNAPAPFAPDAATGA